jgi:hypothetical protein
VEAQLVVPFRDTAADDLVWRLGESRRPALAVLELEVAATRLELRLLGYSHQVVLTGYDAVGEAGADPASVLSEVVACGTGAPGLPPVADRVIAGWDYRFRATTHSLAPERFRSRVDGLVALLAGRPDAIVGRFPGSPHAVTALLAGPGRGGCGVRWRTWHAYPQDGRLVSTATAVRPR